MKPLPLIVGFAGLWAVLEGSARLLGSVRGEGGVVVAALTIGAAIVIQADFDRRNLSKAAGELGFRRSCVQPLFTVTSLLVVLLMFFPAYSAATGVHIGLRPDWWLLVPGLFAQAGLAEETVFRGYLFRRIRERQPFWSAALLAAVPFILVHLTLFFELDPMLAGASLVVALSLTFPLAWVFERAGNSIWPSAILHFAVQAPIKIVEFPGEATLPIALAWMTISTALPWLCFPVLRNPPGARVV